MVFQKDMLISIYLEWKEWMNWGSRGSYKSLAAQRLINQSGSLFSFLGHWFKPFLGYLLLSVGVYAQDCMTQHQQASHEMQWSQLHRKWMSTNCSPPSEKCQVFSEPTRFRKYFCIQQLTYQTISSRTTKGFSCSNNAMLIDYDS